MPDRAEAALHQDPRAAQLRGHRVDGLRRGPDRVPQLPGRQLPPHRGAGGLWAGGERPRPAVHRGHHGPQRGRHRAEADDPWGRAAGRHPRKARHHRGGADLPQAPRRHPRHHRHRRGEGAEADAGQGRGEGDPPRPLRVAGRGGRRPPEPDRRAALPSDRGRGGAERGLPVPVHPCAGGLCRRRGGDRRGRQRLHHPDGHRPAPAERLAPLPAPMRGRRLFHLLRRRGDAPDPRHRGAALYAG